jgi:hypothetical protein
MIGRALVLDDGRSHTAVVGARSLAARGWQVGSGSPRPGLVWHDARCLRWHRVDRPELGVDRFVEQVRVAVGDGSYDIVFPSRDAEVLALSAHREQLGAVVPYPTHEVVRRAFDKLELAAGSRSVGFHPVRTCTAAEPELSAFSYPAVVKARLHWDPAAGSSVGNHAITVCRTPEEARAAASDLNRLGGEPLLQELRTGPVTLVALVIDGRGRVLGAGQMHADKLLRGANVRAVSVAVDQSLLERLRRLLVRIGWVGLAQFDLLAAADGTATPIDLNGRWFMSMAGLEAAGVDLAGLWAADAVGARPAPQGDATAGVRFHWLEGCLIAALRDRSVVGALAAIRGQRGGVHPYWRREHSLAALRYDVSRFTGETTDLAASILGPRRVDPGLDRVAAAP